MVTQTVRQPILSKDGKYLTYAISTMAQVPKSEYTDTKVRMKLQDMFGMVLSRKQMDYIMFVVSGLENGSTPVDNFPEITKNLIKEAGNDRLLKALYIIRELMRADSTINEVPKITNFAPYENKEDMVYMYMTDSLNLPISKMAYLRDMKIGIQQVDKQRYQYLVTMLMEATN